MSTQTRLVLATLCVFNAASLTLLGIGSLAFVDGAARVILAALLWIAAAGLAMVAHRLRNDVEWR
jgi:hypothetical protein